MIRFCCQLFITLTRGLFFTKIAFHFSFLANMTKAFTKTEVLLYNLTMGKLFDPDNPVTVLLSRIFDLILLNICFVITCIPVFTIGPSLCALYGVTLKMADGDFGDILKKYKRFFMQNFRQGLVIWLIVLFSGIFFAADLYVIFMKLPLKYRPLQIPVWLCIFAVVSVFIYAFPMIARYEQSIKQIIKNSVLMSIGNIPLTISIVVILGLLADLSFHNGSILVLLFSLGLFIGNALLARIFSIFIKRAFIKTEK